MNMQKAQNPVKVDPQFKYLVAETPGGESIKHCFQCGKCEATCPIRRFDDSYRPIQIIRSIILGLKDEVLKSEAIWMCASCYSCTERCPQGVKFTDVMKAVRNIASEDELVHRFFLITAGTIAKYCRVFDDEGFFNEIRGDMGLPPISLTADRKEIAKILSKTRLIGLVKEDEVQL
jgi:heterodisulfide reductase subunit C